MKTKVFKIVDADTDEVLEQVEVEARDIGRFLLVCSMFGATVTDVEIKYADDDERESSHYNVMSIEVEEEEEK